MFIYLFSYQCNYLFFLSFFLSLFIYLIMSLQILFVLFAGILLPDQTVSKPYQIFAEEEHQLSHEVNETSDTRSKRQVLLGLRSLCPRMHTSTSQAGPSNSCVKAWYHCPKYNLVEAECNPMSLGCLSSIETHGYPKCEPVPKRVTITLSNGQKKSLLIAINCQCA